MYKIPFFIGTFFSWFVPGRYNRRIVRGNINVLFFYVRIKLFIRRVYGEHVKTIRFVRQVSTNRMTCVVNDRYYVKIFRNVSVQQLNAYRDLLNFIRPYLKVKIPDVFVDTSVPMYVADRLPGIDLVKMNKKQVLLHEERIKSQMLSVVAALQNIDVKSIPNYMLYCNALQMNTHTCEMHKINGDFVLAHSDLNASNLMLDKHFNVISILDWDSLHIVNDKSLEYKSFEQLWQKYKHS
ncbi:MAG: hypothetical protein MJ187_00145 [Alphaproteobacteria bacterium]|nr:hypothetical protein [Alphaproteobacteria bacterium]